MKSPMLVALYFIFASTASWSAGLGIRTYSEPKFASDFSLPDLTGQIHEGSDYRDRAYIISFWATWCVPCIKELPDLQRAAEILDDENIAILTVNSGENREVIEQFLVQRSVTLPVLLDQDSSMLRQWRVLALPTSYIVNAKGQVVARVVGGIDWDELSILARVRSLAAANQNDDSHRESN
ncbi:MAG: TlpA family protein disulfide reductase [Candidatus Thiodiazotropha endolucinida]|nr:TlpA family protein disulfide reductase [Candidatus Thiodiazotropha taylori]MCG8097447.1 TlpA family protein disulfide reductase [Candidatus Thiodiazotropha endolucinida]MCG8061388.1 TlpA family protein disulfide reductase [Candidatus Thiodiazotropha taylori]MCG8065673.1 TlpA family protein disulfide reductase [Candidatus Thiodiazotropha taylori]MCW4331767.1 TlpA family protein disulfide reductase [Candidatus Thiodiazotropha endolucinida]